MNKRIGLLAAGLAVALAAVGGTAFGAVSSSIPDGSGVIHGCYDSGGNLKVIDTTVTSTCPKGYSSVNWNQTGPAGAAGPAGPAGPTGSTGPQGPQGAKGPQGDTGPAGPQGPTGAPGAAGSQGPAGPAGSPGTGATVAAEPPGTNCPNGGASVTDGNGSTAYACTGEAGATGPQGPPGNAAAMDSGTVIWQVQSGTTECSMTNLRGPDSSTLTASVDDVSGSFDGCKVSGWGSIVWAVSTLEESESSTSIAPMPFQSACAQVTGGSCFWLVSAGADPVHVVWDFIAFPET